VALYDVQVMAFYSFVSVTIISECSVLLTNSDQICLELSVLYYPLRAVRAYGTGTVLI